MQFGNTTIHTGDVLRLIEAVGGVVTREDHEDEIYLRFEKENYSRSECFEIAMLMAEMRPDEVSDEEGLLRLWWD